MKSKYTCCKESKGCCDDEMKHSMWSFARPLYTSASTCSAASNHPSGCEDRNVLFKDGRMAMPGTCMIHCNEPLALYDQAESLLPCSSDGHRRITQAAHSMGERINVLRKRPDGRRWRLFLEALAALGEDPKLRLVHRPLPLLFTVNAILL